MNLLQERAVGQLLVDLAPGEFHHGVCVGSDEQAHYVAAGLKYWTVGHPPVKTVKMSAVVCDETREPRDYLPRNHDIVDETEVLVATPQKMREELRSGTWATVRYARALGREIYVVWPNGSIWHENARESAGA